MAGKLALAFRKYKASDRDDCLAAFKSNIPKYFLLKELDQFVDWLTRHGDQEDTNANVGRYFVVLLDDRIVGCGGFAIDKNLKEARMTWGLVDNKYHRQGIGKAFLIWRVNAIREAVPDYRIALDTTQHAAPFFEKMGFETIKITNDSYGEGMHRYDMIRKVAD